MGLFNPEKGESEPIMYIAKTPKQNRKNTKIGHIEREITNDVSDFIELAGLPSGAPPTTVVSNFFLLLCILPEFCPCVF